MKKIITSLVMVIMCGAAVSAPYANMTESSSQYEDMTASANFNKLVSITAMDNTVVDILDTFAEQANVNLVQSEATKGKKVTLTLNEVPIKEALDLVIRATGLSYQILDNSIIVGDPKGIDREIGLNTSVFDLQYAKAEEVKEMLANITKNVQVDKSGNRIIYQASPKVAKEIERVLMRIDRPQQQVLFKAKIKEVGIGNDNKYGIDWNEISNYSTRIREGSVLDWGDWEREDNGDWKFTYDSKNPPKKDMGGDLSSKGPDFKPNGFDNQTSSGFNKVWHRVIDQEYLLSLDFKMRDNEATILAEPEIATLNNRAATVHVGDIIPYTVTEIQSGTSKQSIQKEEVGVKLRVKPIINEGDDITVDVDAEVSSIKGWVGQGNSIPWVGVRKASTTVRVKDGQTIHIGGMLYEDVTNTIDKLPLLGQIPFLGYLFQHHTQTKKTTNLIIEITPYIMVDGKAVINDESTEYDL